MITREWADHFARDWIAAWNGGDIDAILCHYRDDFQMSSPLIRESFGEPSGTLKGKSAIRPYWEQGLAIQPPLHFELIEVFVGGNDIAIHYRSTTRAKRVIEHIEFDEAGLGIRASGIYVDD
jgi:ketosteroid isomerase-like protein